MVYSLLISGFDPTSLPSTPTNAELLQMISQAQYADNIGGIILSDTEPDSTTYPILLRFRWAKTDGSGGLTGEFYYHDGTSWTLEVPGPGTVTAASLANGTVTLDKLYPGGDPYWIIRRNGIATGSPGAGFEMVNITTAISSNTLALSKLINSSSAERFIVSGPGGVWTDTSADDAFTVLFNSANFVTAFNSTSDKILFQRILDDAPCTLTVTNFLTSGLNLATAIVTTENADYVGVLDATDGVFKKVTVGNFLPNTGVTAATYSFPTSISVNAKGQITAISSAGSGFLPVVGVAAFPTVVGTPAVIPHGLAGKPSLVRVVMECVNSNNGYSPGDEEEATTVGWSANNGGMPGLMITTDATNITIGRVSNGITPNNIFMSPKGGGTYFNLHAISTDWQLKAYARL